jgi:hypothetical protein
VADLQREKEADMAKGTRGGAATVGVEAFTVPLKIYRDALLTAVELEPTTRFVLLVLSKWMNTTDGASAFPGWQRLRAATGLGRSTIAKHLQIGHRTGYLARITDSGKGGKAGEYRAAVPTRRWDKDGQKLLTDGFDDAYAKIVQEDEDVKEGPPRRTQKTKQGPPSWTHGSTDVDPEGPPPCTPPLAEPRADTSSAAYAAAPPQADAGAHTTNIHQLERLTADRWWSSNPDSLSRLTASFGLPPLIAQHVTTAFIDLHIEDDPRPAAKWRTAFTGYLRNHYGFTQDRSDGRSSIDDWWTGPDGGRERAVNLGDQADRIYERFREGRAGLAAVWGAWDEEWTVWLRREYQQNLTA